MKESREGHEKDGAEGGRGQKWLHICNTHRSNKEKKVSAIGNSEH